MAEQEFSATATIDFNDFQKVEIRVGTVVRSEPFPEARQPSLKLWVDFGPGIGERKSSAQLSSAALCSRVEEGPAK